MIPAHVSAGGKSISVFSSPEIIDDLPRTTLPRLTSKTLTAPADLKDNAQEITRQIINHGLKKAERGNHTMKVKAGKTHVNVEISGNPDGPVVMMSHSLACNLSMWEPQLSVLEPDFKVIRYDTRGHGQSDVTPGAYDLEMLAADAVSLMDALNVPSAHWVGISLGGMIGQYVAIHHPRRLQSLVLCDTGPEMPEDTQAWWQEKIDLATSRGMASLLDATLEDWFTADYRDDNPPVLQKLRENFLAMPIDGYVGCIWAIRGLHLIEHIKDINVPTLIMVGKQDFGTPVEVSELMHGMIPGSELVVIDGAAHLSSLNQPEIFNKNLIDFLKKQ